MAGVTRLVRLARLVLAVLALSPGSHAAASSHFDGTLLGAVRVTLEREPSIAMARLQVVSAQGVTLSAQGVFDPVVRAAADLQHSATPLPAGAAAVSTLRSDVTTLRAGVTQLLRSGITVQPELAVVRNHDNDANPTAPSQSTVALRFTLPLVRGRGVEVTTAPERAALLDQEAAVHTQRHAIAAAVTRTVLAYWDYLAATQALAIAVSAEARAAALLGDARKLAAGDEIPVSEVRKYQTKLLREASNRLAAAQALVEARSGVGLAMGLDATEHAHLAVPQPGPSLADLPLPEPAALGAIALGWAGQALKQRSDLLAIDSRVLAAQALVLEAADATRPQLDLTVGAGYQGLAEQRRTQAALNALFSNVRGPNAFVGITYEWPVNQRTSQGLLLQRSANLQRVQAEKQALINTVASSIEVRLNSLHSAAAQLRQAQSEVTMQRQIFEDDQTRYRAGMTTVLELFTSEAQLTAAQLNEVNARRAVAQEVIRVRFETGTLLDAAAQAPPQAIDAARLMSIPAPGGAR